MSCEVLGGIFHCEFLSIKFINMFLSRFFYESQRVYDKKNFDRRKKRFQLFLVSFIATSQQ